MTGEGYHQRETAKAKALPWLLWLILYGLLALPGTRAVFEQHPSSHMLLQIPMLALLGALLLPMLPRGFLHLWERCDARGIASLLAAVFCLIFWMVPRALDGAINNEAFEIGKFLSLPFLLGLPLRFAWPRISGLVRGFVTAQFIAMLAYLGWLYSAAPVRLCVNYLEGAQQQLGTHLLLVALTLAVVVCARPLFQHREPPHSGLSPR